MSELTNKAERMTEQLLTNRVRAIESLETATHTVAQAQAGLTSAWNDALKAGWTKAELAKLGLKAPQGKRNSKSSNKSSTTPQAAPAAAANASAE